MRDAWIGRWLAAASLPWVGMWMGEASAQDVAGRPALTCPGPSPAVVARKGGTTSSRVDGQVVDATSQDPLTGMLLHLGPDADLQVVTDSRGHFRVDGIVPGAYRIRVEGMGYGRQSSCVVIPSNQAVDLLVALPPQPIRLEPLGVSVERTRPLWLVRTGFYRRMRAGGGVFITEEKIREQAPTRLSEMFRGEAAVSVMDGNPRPMQTLKPTHPPPGVPGRRRMHDTGTCTIQFLVDGRRTPLVHGVDTFHPKDVAAIEAYFHASDIPPQFNVGNAACGVVNIWLKLHPDRPG